MTIDELTVKITVAAEEAEAALDALLEKVRAFQGIMIAANKLVEQDE